MNFIDSQDLTIVMIIDKSNWKFFQLVLIQRVSLDFAKKCIPLLNSCPCFLGEQHYAKSISFNSKIVHRPSTTNVTWRWYRQVMFAAKECLGLSSTPLPSPLSQNSHLLLRAYLGDSLSTNFTWRKSKDITELVELYLNPYILLDPLAFIEKGL